MEEKENFVCPHCGKEVDTALINSWKARQVGRGTSKKKAASSVENGKKGGRPRKAKSDFSVMAMKDGEMYSLMLVPEHVLGSGAKSRYSFIVCHPGGGQTKAKIQPKENTWPDIELLAEENGFEVIDIRSWQKRRLSGH